MDEHKSNITRGILGIISTGGGAALSFLQQLEIWLRVASLAVGLLIGLLTLISIIKKWNK